MKYRQLQGGFALLTRGFGPHWGHSPQTPNICSRSALIIIVRPRLASFYKSLPDASAIQSTILFDTICLNCFTYIG